MFVFQRKEKLLQHNGQGMPDRSGVNMRYIRFCSGRSPTAGCVVGMEEDRVFLELGALL